MHTIDNDEAHEFFETAVLDYFSTVKRKAYPLKCNDQELLKHIKECMNHVRGIRKQRFRGELNDIKIQTDAKIKTKFFSGIITLKCDLVISKKNGEIFFVDFDYTDKTKNDPRHNNDLIFFAIAFLSKTGKLDRSYKKIVLSVIQPKIDNFFYWDVTIEELYNHEIYR